MKKLYIILLILPLIGLGQTEYKSSKMSFLYPDEYEITPSTQNDFLDVSVRLVPKMKQRKDGLTINLNSEFTSLSQFDESEQKMNMRKTIDLLMEESGVSNYKFRTISYEKTIVFDKEVIYFLYNMEVPDYGVNMNTLQCFYVQNGQGCVITLGYDFGEDDKKHRSSINYILKTLEIY